MTEFKTSDEIFEYLNAHKDTIENAKVDIIVPILLPIFISPLTNEPKLMQEVNKWCDLETDVEFAWVIKNNINLLKDYDLTLYKFKILTGFRGPLDIDEFISYINKQADSKDSSKLDEIVKHKDFPLECKEHYYEIKNDMGFLPLELRQIFMDTLGINNDMNNIPNIIY